MINNNTITIKRGSTTDDLGDTIDGSTVVFSGVPATLVEVSVPSFSEGRWARVALFDLFVSESYPLQIKDIIVDATGTRYAVDELRQVGRWSLFGQWARCSRVVRS